MIRPLFPRNRYEYVRRSGRMMPLPWIVWRFLPAARRRVIDRRTYAKTVRLQRLWLKGRWP